MKKLSRLYLSFRALYRIKLLKQRTPLIITWYLTDHSNNDKPCYRYAPRTEQELTSAEAIDVVDQLGKAGVQRVILTGGDPLSRFDFGGIMDHLQERNISIFVETYGSFVERKIEILKLADRVILPLDGPEPIHDELRYQGSYQEVLRAANILDKTRIPFVFMCTLTSKNVNLVDVPLEIASHYKVGVYFQPVPPILPGSKTAHSLIFSSDRMKQAMIRLKRMKKSQYPNILNTEEALNHFYHYPESSLVHCESRWICAHIDLNGDLLHCNFTRPGYVYNVVKSGFLTAFNNLPPISCTDCWQAYRFNLHGFSHLSIKNIFRLLDH